MACQSAPAPQAASQTEAPAQPEDPASQEMKRIDGAIKATEERLAMVDRQLKPMEEEAQTARQLNSMVQSLTYEDGLFRGYRLDLTLKNTSSKLVTQLFMRCQVETPGRTLPWADKEFKLAIKGGLEPGEVRKIEHKLSECAPEQMPDGSLPGVHFWVTRADGLDGEAVLSTAYDRKMGEKKKKLEAERVKLKTQLGEFLLQRRPAKG